MRTSRIGCGRICSGGDWSNRSICTTPTIRHRIQNSHEDDTLIEAIAVELERDHGFTFVSDARLTASVNVSREEDDNFLSDLEAELETDEEFRTLYTDLDTDARPN